MAEAAVATGIKIDQRFRGLSVQNLLAKMLSRSHVNLGLPAGVRIAMKLEREKNLAQAFLHGKVVGQATLDQMPSLWQRCFCCCM